MVYNRSKFFTNLHVWPWPLNLWPLPWFNFNIPSALIRCISNIKIQSFVHYICENSFFYKLAYLTLTFDLVTLTFDNFKNLWVSIIYVSIINIQSFVHDKKSKQFFYKIEFLTLTFDLVTLNYLIEIIDLILCSTRTKAKNVTAN